MGCSGSKPQTAGATPQAPKAAAKSATKKATFDGSYKRGKTLGEGAFSVVIEATKKDTDESYAVKVVTKSKLTKEDEVALKDEIAVLNELKHQHIIRLYEVFEEPSYYYLVTEQMRGGELFDRIVSKSYYNEKEARDVCKILFESIGFCHSKSVAHRDLKPENLLLRAEDNDSDIKIADFGFAKKVLTPNSLTTQCGTPGYVAPEILEGVPYDTKSDMWSLGVIIYILLGGYPPFIEQNQRELFRKIRKGQYEFHEEYWGSVSDDAKNLISSLLTVDPAKRLSASEALNHKWMVADGDKLAAQDLGTNLAELKKYNAKRKFKAAVNAVILANKLTSLGANFKDNL
ncbi:myosin light chain kinase [Thalassiosira pseudonana CCMP1335]|uniref:non-specific serine/threonine protein kinase n=1 Tax=Thalassiosira pseudonana TaxID=35128 RepID=B8C8L4_THAPS|nr:myosin light chain kinase [Thalassiosira pseudonana CCMP1335]EED90504.1 myosin light chain kinase [Thalassiosira pseudonana CCMP1335]|eukprot:g7593.t1 g7593   contig24:995335-997225(-)